MKDEFLYKYRPSLRKAFADGLYRRLSECYPDSHVTRSGFERIPGTRWYLSFWKAAFVTVIILAVLIFALFQPARAKALEWIRMIAGFQVEERSQSPLIGMDGERSLSAPTENTASPGLVVTRPPTSTPIPATVYEVPTQALPDVLEHPPFEFGMPDWVPEGFVLNQNPGVSENWVLLSWQSASRREIEMLVERQYSGYNLPAGENSSREITIDGRAALLVTGFWDGEHRWDPKRGITIGWEKEGHFYRLNYTERESLHNEIKPIDGDMDLIVADLVKMAESVR